MATGTKTLKIIITASATKAQKTFKKMAAGMRKLVSIGATVGAGIAAGFSVATIALVGFAKSILNSEDALRKQARQLGLTAQELASLRETAKFAGIGFEEIGKSAQFMQRNIAEAVDGTAAQVDAFEKLGLSVEEIQGLNTPEAMEKITIAMQGLESQTDKTQVAMDIFGRSGAKLLNANADAFKRGREEAELFGLAMDEVSGSEVEKINDNITTIKSGLTGLGKQVLAALSEPILKATEAAKGLAKDGSIKLWATQIAIVIVKGAGAATQAIGFLAEVALGAGRAVNIIARGFAALNANIAVSKVADFTDDLAEATKKLEESNRIISEGGEAPSRDEELATVQHLNTELGKWQALLDSSTESGENLAESGAKMADAQGKAFAASEKLVGNLENEEQTLLKSVAAQEKAKEATAGTKAEMSDLADETERAADALDRFAVTSKTITFSGSGISAADFTKRIRNEGGD